MKIHPRQEGVKVEEGEGFICLCGGDETTTIKALADCLEEIVTRLTQICNEGGILLSVWPTNTLLAKVRAADKTEKTEVVLLSFSCHLIKCSERRQCLGANFLSALRRCLETLRLDHQQEDKCVSVISTPPVIVELQK